MKNYEDMSDFEINLAVAKILDLKLTDGQHYKPSVAHWDSNGYLAEFNPCGNWADIGPIIECNGIGVIKDGDGDWNAFACDDDGLIVADYFHRNPKRAAAICFLIMQESK